MNKYTMREIAIITICVLGLAFCVMLGRMIDRAEAAYWERVSNHEAHP